MRVHNLLPSIITALVATGTAQSTTLGTLTSSASSVWTEIESATTCAACEALLVVLQDLAHLGNEAFSDTIAEVCILSGAEDPDVCSGALALEGPILAHDLRNMDIPSTTAQLFCTTIFGLCDYPAVTDYNVPFPSTKPDTTRPASSGESPIQIVHFSDIHVDLSYETGASYNCTKNICCRPYDAEDAPGNTSYPCGPNGNHYCDAPRTLEESLYEAINTYAPDAIFALFTGDVVEGAVWLVTDAEVANDLSDAYNTMSSTLGLPVYAAVGNHDASPVNSFPPNIINTSISSQWVYNNLSSDWDQWIGSTASSEADDYAAYSYSLADYNLRVISINTNLYYKENFWLYEQTMETDPNAQLAWLVDELQAAEDAGQRVYIIGHMPFGTSDALHDGSNYLNQIVNRYDATIAAMFFGHTHKDEFEISYSDYEDQSADNAVAMSYICPSLTPTSGEPAFRVYSVDPVTFGVVDMVEYYTSLESSTYQMDGPTWSEYYSAKAVYGPLVGVTDETAELSPAFWHNLTAVFESNDTAFQEYYARKSRGWDVSDCDSDCKADEICQLRAAEAQYNCVTVTPGIDFKRKMKRNAGHGRSHEGESDCSGSRAKSILASLIGQKEELVNAVGRTKIRRGLL